MAKRLYERLRPCKKLNTKMGWLSPDGKLYACDYAGHLCLAMDIRDKIYPEPYNRNDEYLGKEDIFLIKMGWLQLGTGNFYYGETIYFLPEPDKVTQAQYDTMFDWFIKHKIKLPKYFNNIEVNE